MLAFAAALALLGAAAGCSSAPASQPEDPAGAATAAIGARSDLRSQPPWWAHAVFYEIYLRSFYDSNGDGVGDLNGITAKLDYLAGLGIDAIWITPFYPSPQVDFGYDVSDYENVDPMFGTLADLDRLIAQAHRRHIRVITDLVINHTSDQHPWFRESRSSRDNPKRSWYVWHDAAPGGGPPNTWASVFGPSAWTYDARTAQYYYHFFYPQQPDLNWRNPQVESAMFDVMRFWLRRGVDGFRLDAVDALFEDRALRPNPYEARLRPGSATEHQQHFKYNEYQPENFEEFRRLRRVVQEFGPDRLLIAETYPRRIGDLRRYYGAQDDAFQLPFNFALLRAASLDAASFRARVRQTEWTVRGRPTAYVLSNHDTPRAYDRLGDGKHDEQIAKLLTLMLLTLRGTPFFYYGEEIGMQTTPPQHRAEVRDPVGKLYWPANKGRDGERTPMQWSAGPNAGFTSAAQPWLPIPPGARARNVDIESRDPSSILSFFEEAVRLRRASPALLDGDYRTLGDDPRVLAYRRRVASQTMIVVLNMSSHAAAVRLDPSGWGGETELVLRMSSARAQGARVNAARISLAPYEAAVLEVVKGS